MFFFIHLLVFLIIIYSTVSIASFDLIEHDDVEQFFAWYECPKNFLINSYHGRTIINLITSSLLSIIPNSLQIHPIVWINTTGAIFKGIFIAILCYQLSSLLFLFNPKDKKYSFIQQILTAFFSIVLYSMYLQIFQNTFQMELYTAFYGFTFPFIFFILFWKKFILFYLDDEYNKKDYLLYFLAFINGATSEFFSFVSVAALFILFIIDRFSLNTSFKKILPSFVFTLIPAVLYIFNKGFLSTWDEKIDNITYDTCFSYISAFLSEYKTVLFNEYSMFIALIVIILVYLTTRNKEKNEKFIISILSLVAGLFAFLSSLLFAGMRENYTFISHLDIIIQAKTTFLIIIFLLISYILNQKRSLYILSIIALFVTLCSISIAELSSVYQFAIKNKDYKAIHIEKYAHRDIEQYRNRYVNEYIYLWCLYNNKTDNLVFNELFEYSKPSIPYYFKSVYDVDITLHNIDFDKIKYLPNNNKNAVYEHYISIGGNEIPEFYSAEKPNFNKLLDKENF